MIELEVLEGCRAKLLDSNELPLTDYENSEEIVKDYLGEALKGLCKEPTGELIYPYVVPGAEYQDLWDWDSFFVACALPDSLASYGVGAIKNLINGMAETGRPTKKYTVEGYRERLCFPYPLHAQFCYVMAKKMGDFAWIKPFWSNLKRMREWFDNNSISLRGYYMWSSKYGNGLDNNPQVYGLGDRMCAGVDLASWHYRDLVAMYKLALIFEPEAADFYKAQAEKIKQQIQTQYFDKMDNCFYAIATIDDPVLVTAQPISWNTYLKFRSSTCFYPLWAGAATEDQAKCIRDFIMSSDEFLSPVGIRSHSKADPVYNNIAMEDPSNWQGPVWGLTSYMAALGLARYGYKEDALEICRRMNMAFANDIKENGCLHEYYHGDNGQPIMRPGFISWNALAFRAAEDIRRGIDCTTYDLLD